MLGKRASLKPLLEVLRKLNVTSIRSTRLVQGKTMRWAIAWSFVVENDGQARVEMKHSRSSASPSSVSQKREFSIDSVSLNEISQRLVEFVQEEHSRNNSDFQNLRLDHRKTGTAMNRHADGDKHEFFIVADAPALQVRLLVKEQVEKTDANNCADNLLLLVSVSSSLGVADAKLLDRTLSKLERDLKRTGRYWRRRLKRRKL